MKENKDSINGDAMRLSLRCREIKIELEDETGQVQSYTLQELPNDERDKYLNSMGRRARWGADGTPAGIRDYIGIQSELIAMSIRDAQGNKIPVKIIDKWPSSVLNALYKKAFELSDMDKKPDEVEEEAKKD